MIFFPEAKISPSLTYWKKTAKETKAMAYFSVCRCISQSFASHPSMMY